MRKRRGDLGLLFDVFVVVFEAVHRIVVVLSVVFVACDFADLVPWFEVDFK